MVVPFEDNKYNTKEIYTFGLFSRICVWVVTGYVIPFVTYIALHYFMNILHQPCCILNKENELPCIQISKCYAC